MERERVELPYYSEKVVIVPLKVTLLRYIPDPEDAVAIAIKRCVSNADSTDIYEELANDEDGESERLINLIITHGHDSPLENAVYQFGVEGISRAASHQLVRHRIASYAQLSQRKGVFPKRKSKEDFMANKLPIVLPPGIANDPKLLEEYIKGMEEIVDLYRFLVAKGVKAEDARSVLPNCTETKLIITKNARALMGFFEERLCQRSQLEIRSMAQLMKKELLKVSPTIFQYAGPTCETQHICFEGSMSCGRPKVNPKIEMRQRVYLPETL